MSDKRGILGPHAGYEKLRAYSGPRSSTTRPLWLVFFRGIFSQSNLSWIARKNPEEYLGSAARIFAGEAAKYDQDKNFI